MGLWEKKDGKWCKMPGGATPGGGVDPSDIESAVNKYLEENPPAGGVSFTTDESLSLRDGVLSVNTADEAAADNTLPITSAAVHTQLGNIELLLQTI